MKILLVGGGGREHALAWRLHQEDPSIQLFAAPGNPGIADLATCVPISVTSTDQLASFAAEKAVDFTLVGPEAPLAAGIVDQFRAKRLPIFGPSRAAAEIETSKAFSKSLMLDAGVPTARARTCNSLEDARRAIDELGAPVVVKASGLAAGKGVIVCASPEEGLVAARYMLEQGAFGDAGRTVLIEEFMEGEELSLFAITDGERAIPMVPAQDHKRLLDGDHGPNTGGMGAYAPVSLLDAHSIPVDAVLDRIIYPTLSALRSRNAPFTGLLYAGLMITNSGPKVVEFNCRFGDPETQAVLPAMAADVSLTTLLQTVARGDRLDEGVRISAERHAVTTVLAAQGYPDKPRAGDPIDLPDQAPADTLIFHAGTKRDADGKLVTSGGRVLTVTGLGESMAEARQRSQKAAALVQFAGKQYRTDIGWRELERAGAA